MDLPNNIENELLEDWIKLMNNSIDEYLEPSINESVSGMLKSLCIVLKQDIHVFVMSIEILERYVNEKNKLREIIEDLLVIIFAVILISCKSVGEQTDLKITQLNECLCKVAEKQYNIKVLKLAELDILEVLTDKIPITSKVDDLNTFVENYIRNYQLRADLRDLCLSILELLYILRYKWFYELKTIYNQNIESKKVFEKLICSKFYLPVGILICALKLTKYKNFLSIQSLTIEFTKSTRIHPDHINVLTSKIMNIVNRYLI